MSSYRNDFSLPELDDENKTWFWDLLVNNKRNIFLISAVSVVIVLVGRCKGRKIMQRAARWIQDFFRKNIRKNGVKVLCEDNAAEYAQGFKNYIKREFDRNVEWVTPGANADDITKSKHLLIFDVRTRIPDDLQFTLSNLGLGGKTLGSNVLAVAMNRSPIGNENDVNEFTSIDTTDYDICSFNLIAMNYSGVILYAKDNKKAHQTIKRFLSF